MALVKDEKQADLEASLGSSPVSPHEAIDRSRNTNPISLSFSDINYSIEIPDKKTKTVATKVILDNIHGNAKAGTMLAIMGPTGSGKTSLLNVLANRLTRTKNASLTGEFLCNGKQINASAFARLTSYVMQDDAM
jgi:ABC-type transporter Mla maintaining outer membrane lipid asymmetry ATPase subunit MlaF